MLKVLIRTDASYLIGSGHVMRCLTLAKQFKGSGHSVSFWTEPLEGNMDVYIKQQGFEVIHHVTFVDILIVDHYQLDHVFEKTVRSYAKKIVVIDDLADRQHDCDMIVDQNMVENYDTRYDKRVPPACIKLLGPKYLIMRDEFIEARQHLRVRGHKVERLLVFMGGSDPTQETLKILDALQHTSMLFKQIDIVVGQSNPYNQKIKAACEAMNINYYCQIDYLAQLMNEADFAIGSGGSAMWERCYVGLPSSSTIVATNQLETTKLASQLGAVLNLGWHEEVSVATYKHLIDSLTSLVETCAMMSEKGLNLTANQDTKHALINEMVGLIYD